MNLGMLAVRLSYAERLGGHNRAEIGAMMNGTGGQRATEH